jgi:peptidoglycan-N-acetylglucosamine deacetylase
VRRRAWVAGAAGLLTLHLGLPYLLVQRLGLGTLREGRRARRELSLTFDDGPDPATTPAVLDALQAAGARATFFVLVAQARAHPALLARLQAEGHEVGLHAVTHRHAWARSPWDALQDPLRGARELAALTGRRPTLYRPPHGAYSLPLLLGLGLARLSAAHWSTEGGDWRPGATPGGVQAGLLARIHPGAVVVLHDAGPGARLTVPLLPGLLAELAGRGYRLVPLRELDGLRPLGPADLPRRLLGLLDRAVDRLGGVRYSGQRADSLFRAGLTRFPLSGAAEAPRGAPAIEFHVSNPQLVDAGLRPSLRAAPADLRALARDIMARPDWQAAQAVYCLSALAPMLAALGFTTRALPPWTARRLSLWATVLRRAHGTPVLKDPRPQLSVMTMGEFLRRYGEAHP